MWTPRNHCTDKCWKTLFWGSRYFENIMKSNSLLFSYLKMKELSELDQYARNGECQEAGAGCGNEQKAVGLKKNSWVSGSFWATEALALRGLKQGRCDCVCVFVSESSHHHFLIRTKTPQGAWCHSFQARRGSEILNHLVKVTKSSDYWTKTGLQFGCQIPARCFLNVRSLG